MITNQIINRENLAEQRTKDGYFNANKLIEIWNDQNPNKVKQLGSYKNIQSTKDFISYLKNNEDVKSPIISGRGKNGGTWMHPKVFIDFAMWVSLEFKSKVLDWVLDGLIQSRHDAGDYYKEMCAAIMKRHIEYYGSKPNAMIFVAEANMIKDLAKLDRDRNNLSESELNKLTILQKVNSTLIRDGVGKKSRMKQLQIVAKSI